MKPSLLSLYRKEALIGSLLVSFAAIGIFWLFWYRTGVWTPLSLVLKLSLIGCAILVLVPSVVCIALFDRLYRQKSVLPKSTDSARLHSLLDSAAMYVIRTDAHGYFTFANRSFLETFVAPEDRAHIIGVSYTTYIIPDDHAAALHVLGECITNPTTTVSVRLRKPALNGTVLLTEWKCTAIVGDDGSIQEIQYTGFDRTEPNSPHQKVEEEHSTLDNLVASINGIIWEADAHPPRLTYISPSAERMLGYSLQEWFDDPLFWENHLHPDDRDGTIQLFMDATGRVRNHILEYRFVNASGEIVWIYDAITVESREGKPLRLNGIMVDVTRQKQVEIALHAAEENFRSAVNSLGEGITMQEQDSTIFFCNSRAEEILGLTRDQIEGRTSLDPTWRVIREDGSSFPGEEHPSMVTIRTGRAQQNVVMGVYKPDGSLTWILANSEPIRYSNGKEVSGVVVSFVDITLQKAQESLLRFSEQQLQLAIESSEMGLWDWYVQTGKAVFNNQWAAMLGYSLEELVPMGFDTFLHHSHPDDLDIIQERLQAHFRKETDVYEVEIRMRHKSGAWVWVLSRGKVVEWNSDGTPYRMTGTHLDMTERKLIENELRRSEQQFRAIIDASPIPFALNDEAGNILYLNPAFVKIFGYDRSDIPTLSDWWKAAYPDEGYREWVINEWQQTLLHTHRTNEPSSELEVIIRAKNGSNLSVLISAAQLDDQQFDIHLVILVDITERKGAAESIRKSEANLRAVFDASVQTHFLISTDYRIQLWNTNATKRARVVFEREVQIGDDMRNYILPDNIETFEQNFQLALQGVSSCFERSIRLPSGTMDSWYEYQYIPIRDSRGEVIGISWSAMDITEQKNALEQLRVSEQRYRAFVELQGAYFVRTDMEGRYTYASPSMLRDYSTQGVSVIGKNGLEHIIPEDHDIVRNTIERCLQAPNTPVNVILRKPHVSGRIFTTDWEFIAITNSEGTPIEIQCVGHNITDRVQIESLLAASEEKYRSMVHNIADIITLIDAKGTILYESSSIRTILGWSETDLIGHSIFEYLHSDDIVMVQERFGNVVLHEKVENTAFRFRHKNGEYIFLEGLASNQLDNPAIRSIIVTSRDVTERNIMLSRLAEYSEELHNIIDSMLDGLLLLDEQQHIMMVNPALVEMFGYSADTLVEMPLSALIPERFRESHKKHEEVFHHVPMHRQRVRSVIGLTESGLEFPIDVSLASFEVNGKRLTLAIVRDITEQKQAHEEIMQLNKTLEFRVEERTRELQALNNEKNEMLGIAAHDLKNPLASILSGAEILERYFSADDSIKRFAAMIIAASNQMMEIITNLLDVNKIESGAMSPEIQAVNLSIINGILKDYQPRATLKGIIVRCHFTEQEDLWVYADKQMLTQALDNLVSNAIKYSPHWKNVWVRVALKTTEDGRKVGRVEIQDEGPGISEEDRKKLFHKFSRLTAQPTGGEHSTGLGLSIVKKLVELQQGQVWCESTLGKGATFIIELPAAERSTGEDPKTGGTA